MLKKNILTLIIISLVFLGWFFRDFFQNNFLKSEEKIIEINSNQETKKENNSEEILKDEVIAKGQIKTAILIKEQEIIYFNQNNFLKTDLIGKKRETLSSFPFPNLREITCSKNGKNCLLKTDVFGTFDLEKKEIKKLNSQIKEVSFNFQQDGLIYLFKENNHYQLNTADLFGKNWLQLQTIKGDNIKIKVNPKKNELVYFFQELTGEERGIFLTNLIKNNQPEKIVDKNIIDVKWSPSGKKLLFSFYDNSTVPQRVNLGFYDFQQKQEFEIGIPSISEKCAWSEGSDILYCGALTNAENLDFNLEKWENREFVSKDFFWEINLNNSERKRLFQSKKQYPLVDAFNLFVFRGELFFIDKISGNLIKREL